MSGSPNDVSFRDTRFYAPYTGEGFLLDTASVTMPRLHECGTIIADPSWNYRKVCSPFWHAYFNLEPGAAVRINGALCPLRPGHLVIIPQEVSYDCICTRNVRHLWVHFSLELENPPNMPIDLKLEPIARKLWDRVVLEIKKKQKPALPSVHYMCLAALLDALRHMGSAQISEVSASLRSLLQWFDTHMTNPPSLEEMAARSGMGRRTFIRWFYSQTGSTPASYMRRRRIREACRLLRFSSASIEQIAEMTGFANRHHFTRIFSTETGNSPSAFRKGA